MRKQNDYEMMDRIMITLEADDAVSAAVDEYRSYIMKETLAEELVSGAVEEKVNINGHKTGIAIEKK